MAPQLPYLIVLPPTSSPNLHLPLPPLSAKMRVAVLTITLSSLQYKKALQVHRHCCLAHAVRRIPRQH